MEHLSQLQEIFHNLPIEAALKQTADLFPPGRVKLSSSLGQEDQVLTDIIGRNKIGVHIFTLDTGRLFYETYDVLEILDRQDRTKLPEELGDVLLQVLFHSQIASEAGSFTIEDVLEQLADKLIRRHPHVFKNGSSDPTPTNADQVVMRWEDIKRTERQDSGRPDSVFDGVPQTLPALLRAFQIQARAARVGFDWTHDTKGFDQVLGKIEEEIQELRTAIRSPASNQTGPDDSASTERQAQIVAEFGDVVFSLVNLARFIKVNPEDALRQAVNRFIERFQFIESRASESGRAVGDLSFAEMDRLWDEAKRQNPVTLTEEGRHE